MRIFDLSNKTAVITGGYGYLGSAMCRGLASAGATIYVLGRSEEKFKKEFKEDNSIIHFQKCDVSSTQDVKQALKSIFQNSGTLDILVNNAVFLRGGQKPLEITDGDWAYSIEGALNSVYRCIREAIQYLRKSGEGKIINISSMYGMVSPDFSVYDTVPQYFNPPHYDAAKAGVIQLTRYFAQLLGPENIKVNAISPGPFPGKTVQESKAFIHALEEKTALKRIGQPEELIGAIIFLSSNAASYITGHNLVVDGGWTIH